MIACAIDGLIIMFTSRLSNLASNMPNCLSLESRQHEMKQRQLALAPPPVEESEPDITPTIVNRLLNGAKTRARKFKREFDLDACDIIIPEYCPILSIRLRPGAGKHNDGSPTLDRIDNKRGYVRGNVRVISMRANRLKSNATLDEMHLVYADFLRCHGLTRCQ